MNTIIIHIFILFSSSLVFATDDFFVPVTPSHEIIDHFLTKKSPNPSEIFICYNYSCHTHRLITISPENVTALQHLFAKGKITAEDERKAIAQAIALLEQFAGSQSPVHNDKARNFKDNYLSGRMDCIDSTINTSHYLEFLYFLGLMTHHEIVYPAYRSPFFMAQHWSAQIKEKNSSKLYVVDSWQSDNGQKPVIQAIELWCVILFSEN